MAEHTTTAGGRVEWHFQHGGAMYGPLSAEALTTSIKAGGLTPNTLVWREGMDVWTPADELAELGLRSQEPPLEQLLQQSFEVPLAPMMDPPAPTVERDEQRTLIPDWLRSAIRAVGVRRSLSWGIVLLVLDAVVIPRFLGQRAAVPWLLVAAALINLWLARVVIRALREAVQPDALVHRALRAAGNVATAVQHSIDEQIARGAPRLRNTYLLDEVLIDVRPDRVLLVRYDAIKSVSVSWEPTLASFGARAIHLKCHGSPLPHLLRFSRVSALEFHRFEAELGARMRIANGTIAPPTEFRQLSRTEQLR